jgi:hypothetical protein
MRDTGDWFARQLAHVRACVAEAERSHSPEQLRLAELALAGDPCSPQRSLFHPHIANRGVATPGQPDPAGRDCAFPRAPERP